MILPQKVQTFLNEITHKINPKFEIKNKANPTGLYKIASMFIRLFNKEVDERYITVINGNCWFPASYFDSEGNFIADADSTLYVLAHETMHEYDRKRLGTFLFSTMYLFPQVLVILSLLSIFAIWNLAWLTCLFFLLLVLPLPAIGRAYIELRGYRVNVMLNRLSINEEEIAKYAEWISETQFCSSYYYFMFPFKSYVIEKLLERDFEQEEIYKTINEWFKANVNL